MAKDYYAILGVLRDASSDDIKKAYRELAPKFHPDFHPGDRGSEEQFKEVQEAYDVLSEPEKRKEYDQVDNQWKNADSEPQPSAGPSTVDVGSELNVAGTPHEALQFPSSERRWAWSVALLAVALTMFPYLVGWAIRGDRVFTWLGQNILDACVYLSWTRQAADGHLIVRNLFTTDPQHGMAMNPLFLVLGAFARLTGIPLVGVYHISRLVFGFLLLVVVWEFIRLIVADDRARRFAFLCVVFASGLGWLPIGSYLIDEAPIDRWQPEAVTYLSLYLSPLFCFSMLLQVAIFALLVKGERAGKARFAVGAGACGFLLGLTHSYDVMSVAAVWLAFLVVRLSMPAFRAGSADSRGRPFDAGPPMRALIAGAIALPAVGYVYLQYRSETVFRARADFPTSTCSFRWIVAGYGLTLVLAMVGACVRRLRRVDDPEWTTGPDVLPFLVVWAVVNAAVAYIPISFQRKLLQGEHFPIAILAGIGTAYLVRRLSTAFGRRVPFAPSALILVLALAPSNLRFLLRDIANFQHDESEVSILHPYLKRGEVDAMNWLNANAPRDAAVQPLLKIRTLPDGRIKLEDMTLATRAPGYLDRAVYFGHYGETPDAKGKLTGLTRLVFNIRDTERLETLRAMRVRYIVFYQKDRSDPAAPAIAPFFRGLAPAPRYLRLVHSNPDADVYEFVARTTE